MADTLNTPISKDLRDKAREARRLALLQGQKFDTAKHLKDFKTEKPSFSWSGFREGAQAGAQLPFLQLARLFGSDAAAQRIQKLKQQGAYNSKDWLTNPFGKDVLQTSGIIGNAGYASALAAAGLAGAGAAGVSSLGSMPAGQALAQGASLAGRAGLKGLKGAWKLYKPMLPYDIASVAGETTGRYLNKDKIQVSKALAQGNEERLKTPQQKALYRKQLIQNNLGLYNPNDPESVKRYREASGRLADTYASNVNKWRLASSAPFTALSWRSALTRPGTWARYIIPALQTGGDLSTLLSQRKLSDTQIPYNLQKATQQDIKDTVEQTYAQQSPFLSSLKHTGLGLTGLLLKPFENKPIPANHIAALSYIEKYNPSQEQIKNVPPKIQQTIRQAAFKVDPSSGAYTPNKFMQWGIKRFLNKEDVRNRTNELLSLYQQLNQASTPQQKQAVLKQLRDIDRSWTQQDSTGFSKANKQKIVLMQHLDKDPELQKYVFQDIVKKSPKELKQFLQGYEQLWKDPEYLKIQKGMSPAIQKALQRQKDYIQKAVTQNFVNGLKDRQGSMKQLDAYLQDYYDLSSGGKLPSEVQKQVQKTLWDTVQKDPASINKLFKWWAKGSGMKELGNFLGNPGAFYGSLAMVGLPLTISLMRSLFGGSEQPQQVQQIQQQPMAYAPRGITERGLIVG